MNNENHAFEAVFLSRYDLEHFTPQPNSVLISISDSVDDAAAYTASDWVDTASHYFVDCGYDEESIEMIGADFDHDFKDYITPEKASALRHDITRMLSKRPDFVVINCQAGRSRSAAVARYLKEIFHAQVNQETPEANMTVFRLLMQDPELLMAINSARSQAKATTRSSGNDEEQSLSFLSRIFSRLLGRSDLSS